MNESIVNAKMRRMKAILTEEDKEKDCVRIICDVLYGKSKKEDYTINVDETELDKKEINEADWDFPMERVVAEYMKKNYKKSVNGKNVVPHYISRKDEKRKKISKQQKQEKQYEFCFTNLGEIEEKYIQWTEKTIILENTGEEVKEESAEENEVRKQEQRRIKVKEVSVEENEVRKQEQRRIFDKYYYAINNDFSSYYKGIQQTIMSSPAFLKYDLPYILLQSLWLDISENCLLNQEMLSIWEEKYEFLDFPNMVTRDTEKSNRKYFKYMKEKSSTKFPYSYKFEENGNGKFYIQKANIEIQLALIFYKPFRKLYSENGRKAYEFEKIKEIIGKIEKMVQDNENEEEKEIEKMLFPYLIEKVFGINLCCEFTQYYEAISKLDEFDDEVANSLNHIFCLFCSMPNVFSRIQILREFMEAVILFGRNIKRQLIIIDRLSKEMNSEYLENTEKIINIFKEFEKTKNPVFPSIAVKK